MNYDDFGTASFTATDCLLCAVTRIQKFSSYTFGAFTAMHMANTSLIPLLTRSVPASEPYLLLTRPYYQSVVAEPLLVVAPLVAHVSSGVALRLLRRRQNLKRYGAESRNDRRLVAWPSLSGTSLAGLVLVPLVVGHAYLNRLLPLIVEGGSSIVGLQYVSHGFAKHPIVSNVGFSLLVGTAAGHFVWGSSRWMGFHPDSIPGARSYGEQRAKRRRYLLHAITAAVAALWLSGGLGVVGRAGELAGWLGREYDHIYSQIPLIGHML